MPHDGKTAVKPTATKKTTRLKQMIQSPELSFLMEAHNGLSAKVVEEAGFDGIWGSGLSISAALGVRDNNEASWTQVLEVVEFMADATKVPILLDGDTGYGNFNSMRRLVTKLEQRGVAGVCIEDKIFPKTNSFIRGSAQPLAEIDEFAGKIKAGKEAQNDPDFVIVARVEAFIAGWGLDEAMRRAEAYRVAGADAILIHSALRSPSEILSFKKEWGDRLPVVIVPTKYYTTPTDVFREHKISVCIWANHVMRSALTAMKDTAKQIFQDQNLLNVEDKVATVAEVFRIQGESELEAAEKLYLPKNAGETKGIVLAAARGEELGDLTAERPKAMVDIAGKPVLAHIAAAYRAAGIKDITVVTGYKKEVVNLPSLTYVANDEYATTNEVVSLSKAAAALGGPAIISYGDVLFKKYILQQLMDTDADFAVAVDADWKDSKNRGRLADYAICSVPNTKKSLLSKVTLKDIVSDGELKDITGEWMGFLKLSAKGAGILKEQLSKLEPATARSLKMPDLIKAMMKLGHEIEVIYTTGHWLDIDSVEDVVQGSAF
ncbi:MAG: Phosphoenolpyruvate phosphomutase [Myxococcaceae bacterium]|nr:Phosphoenolpyruvate phosphomutase [Myxococcaceae bacterium]